MFDVVGMFFDFLKPEIFDIFSALLIIAFIQWELPRTIKIIDEEYTSDLYPETGRVIDIFMFIIGLGAMFYLYTDNTMIDLLRFMNSSILVLIFIPVMIVVPLIIFMGYFKRFFARVDAHKSMTIFLVQSTLDLAHTLFFVSLSILVIPSFFFLVFGN